MKRIALIDGDSIAYYGGTCRNKTEMEIAVNYKLGQILEDTNADCYELYLEEWRKDKKNFRAALFDLSNEFRSKPGYKGNRSGIAKPKMLDKAREYMVEAWKAEAVMRIESEDMVIARAYEVAHKMYPIICFIDKDLLQHPLEYYNYDTCETITLTVDEAELRLWRQVCTGDGTDNIPGIPRVGKVTANKKINDPETARLDAARLFIEKGMSYEYFIEQYNLIRIRSCNTTKVLKPVSKKEYNQLIQE